MDSGNDLLSEHLRSPNHVGVNQNNDPKGPALHIS
jgi:hypothetical protein